jgi:hypothetical protein
MFKISNCLKYVGSFSGFVCTGYDWPAVESILRLARLSVHPLELNKLQAVEKILVKFANKKEDKP